MSRKKIDEDRIRDAAYLMWIEEGQPHGRDEEHWERAREMLASAKPAARKAAKPPAKPKPKRASAATPKAASTGKSKTPAAPKKTTARKATKATKS